MGVFKNKSWTALSIVLLLDIPEEEEEDDLEEAHDDLDVTEDMDDDDDEVVEVLRRCLWLGAGAPHCRRLMSCTRAKT